MPTTAGLALLLSGAAFPSPAAAQYQVAFKNSVGNFITYDDDYDGVLLGWDTSTDSPLRVFTLVDDNGCALMHGDSIRLKASNNLFVTAEPGGAAYATAAEAGEAERFIVEMINPSGHLSNGGPFRLKQPSTGFFLEAHDRGALFFSESPYGDEGTINVQNVTQPWEPFAFELIATPRTVLSAGFPLFVAASDSTGGPTGGTNKYSFSFTSGTGQSGYRAQGSQRYWVYPRIPPGRYTLSAQAYRYCGDIYVTKTSQSITGYEVCKVDFTAPLAGQSVPASGHTATWTAGSSCSNRSMRLEFRAGTAAAVSVATAQLASGSVSWSLPAGTPATAQGKLALRNPQETGNSYSSGVFVIPSNGNRPDFAVIDVRVSPTACHPGEHWVEFTVNATAQRSLPAEFRIENQETQQVQTVPRNLTLTVGTTRHRVDVEFPDAAPRKIELKLDPAATIAETSEENNQKTFYSYQAIPSCSP